jgi:hypothetical protein
MKCLFWNGAAIACKDDTAIGFGLPGSKLWKNAITTYRLTKTF